MRSLAKILFLILFIVISNAEDLTGKLNNPETVSIGGKKFYNINDLKIFEYVNDIKRNKIIFKSGIIKYAANSFYLVYESEDELMVFQMRLPVIIRNDKEFIHKDAFTDALKYFDLPEKTKKITPKAKDEITLSKKKKTNKTNDNDEISEQNDTKEIDIKQEDKTKKTENLVLPGLANEQINFSGHFFELAEKLKDHINTKPKKRELKEKTDELKLDKKKRLELPPNVYLIPDDLKRKEIEKKE